MQTNLERLLKLAEEIFNSESDPQQLTIDEEVITQLRNLDPNSVIEKEDEFGPFLWVILFPTTAALMAKFLTSDIGEQELFQLTFTESNFDSIYLCSALVLPEYRLKGYVKQAILKSINNIQQTHRIKNLFVWSHSEAGRQTALAIAKAVELPLYFRG